jgi:hypothetical protein
MKVYKKNSILFIKILTFIFLVIFLFNLDVFRKFYNILNNSYDQRIYKTYGFCSDQAVGFVKYIITKLLTISSHLIHILLVQDGKSEILTCEKLLLALRISFKDICLLCLILR